jgi:hypothetical protein
MMAKRRKKKVPKGVSPLIVKYRARLDHAWSKAIHDRFDGACFISGGEEHVNAHHIVDRRCYSCRWDVENGILLSPLNHKWSPNKGMHNNPLYVLQRIQLRLPSWWNRLLTISNEAKTLHEMTETEQASLVKRSLKVLRPDLYEKDFHSKKKGKA